MVIVSSGCSYAYGYGLEDRESRYASILSKAVGAHLVDVSCSGASNDTVAAYTVAGINIARQQHPGQPIIVLAGWTSQARMEYFDHRINTVLTAMAWTDDQHHKINKLSRKDVVDNMWHPAFGYYRFLQSFAYVQNTCDAHGIPCFHTLNLPILSLDLPIGNMKNRSMTQSILTEHALTKEQQVLLDQLLRSDSMQDQMRKMNMLDDTNHPTEEGHKRWAIHLTEQLEDVLGT